MPATECRTRWAQTTAVNAVLTRADVRLSDNERARGSCLSFGGNSKGRILPVSRSAASVTSAAAPIQGRSKLELGEIGCELDGPTEGRGGFCSHGLHQGLGGHVREHQPANPRCSRGATDVARRGVSLAMDLAAVLIQASRFVDQHVSPLNGLDEPGNRPRVAAVRESCAV